MKTATAIKHEILNHIFKTKDGASWNEVSEMLNELIYQSGKEKTDRIPDSYQIFEQARENDEKSFKQWWWEMVYKDSKSEPTPQEQPEPMSSAEELWDSFSESVGESYDDVGFYAGRTVMVRDQFIKAIKEYAKLNSRDIDWEKINRILDAVKYQVQSVEWAEKKLNQKYKNN